MSAIDKNIINNWAKQITENHVNAITVNDNLELSAELKNEFNVYNKTWKILKEMQEIEQFDTDKAWKNLFTKIDLEKDVEQVPKVRSIKLNNVLALAASVIVLIGIAGFYLSTQLSTIGHKNTTLTAQMITLPDGSEVYLNANTEINYKKGFGTKTREVSLKGEAFFNVTKDKNKPFIVQTDKSFVRVLGTSFNVNAKTNIIEVAVKTGRVEVYNKASQSEHVILLPGDYALLNGFDKIDKNLNSNVNYLSWMDKKLVFKALPLSQVINDLRNAYNCDIGLADTSFSNLKITTTFENDPIEDVLKSISLAFNLNIKMDGKKYILVSN